MMVGRDLGELYHRTPREPRRGAARDPRPGRARPRRPRPAPRGRPLVRGPRAARSSPLPASSAPGGPRRCWRSSVPCRATGEVRRGGSPAASGQHRAPRSAAGISLVTEDRKEIGPRPRPQRPGQHRHGQPRRDRSERGIVQAGVERGSPRSMARSLQLRPPRIDLAGASPSAAATSRRSSSPSGWRGDRRILLLDEPTRGVDVGAKAEIFAIIDQLRADGTAILMVSSDLREVLGVADRILVLHEGRPRGRAPRRRGATQEAIMGCHATRTSRAARSG